MKVVLVLPTLERGGCERQIDRLLPQWCERHSLTVVSLLNRGDYIQPWSQREGVRVVTLADSRFGLPMMLPKFVRLLGEVKPDVVQGFMPPANCLVSLAKQFLPQYRTVLGVRASNMVPNHWLGRLARGLEGNLGSRVADAVVFNSHSGRKHRPEFTDRRQATWVVPNAMDPRWIRDRTHGPDCSPAGDPAIGSFARLVPMKGLTDLIEAFSYVQKDKPQAQLHLYGRGGESELRRLFSVAEQVGCLEALEYHGEVANPYPVMSRMDMVVSSSRYGEGMSNTLMEAMVLGRRIVATDVGDSARLLANYEGGIIVPPEAPRKLATGMREVLGRSEPSPRRSPADWPSPAEVASAYTRVWSGEAPRNLSPEAPDGRSG